MTKTMNEIEKKKKGFTNWKVFFYGSLIIALILDIFGEGMMVVGIIIGWLVGLMTVTQWNIEEDKLKKKLQGI